jgi:hypothetical protein
MVRAGEIGERDIAHLPGPDRCIESALPASAFLRFQPSVSRIDNVEIAHLVVRAEANHILPCESRKNSLMEISE